MSNTTPHRATPEQWQSLDNDGSTFAYEACILELRARVEALEAAQQQQPDHFADAGKMVSAGSLVERVGNKIPLLPDGRVDDASACAAIREVAAWLREIGNNGSAFDLEQEVDRG